MLAIEIEADYNAVKRRLIDMKRIITLSAVIVLMLCTACADTDSDSSDNSVVSMSDNNESITHESNTESIADDNKAQVDWKNKNVYKWQDYYEADEYQFGEDFELKLELTEFPDTVFIWRDTNIYACANGQEHMLVSGMPLWNAFYTDLNSDGFPELCATVSMGSGIVDEHIIVYDYHNEKEYILEDRTKYDYSLYIEDDELCVRQLPYSEKDKSKAVIGTLAIKDDGLVFKH